MRKPIIILMSIIIIGSHSQAFESASRQSEAYAQAYVRCVADPSNFKIDSYINAYQQSLEQTLQIAQGSGSAIQSMVKSGGTSPFLQNYLNDENIGLALQDCFKGETARLSFIRNLILLDVTGKSVGISIGTLYWAGYAVLSLASFEVPIGVISKISSELAIKLSKVTAATVASLEIYKAKRKHDRDGAVASENGNEYLLALEARLANININAKGFDDTKLDIQFDISLRKAESLERRPLTAHERSLICKHLPGAIHRCSSIDKLDPIH